MVTAEALREALDAYDEALSIKSRTRSTSADIAKLDSWYRTDLRKAIQSRSEPHLTKAELVKLMQWKLAHGKWRPNLEKYIREGDAEEIEAVTREALGDSSKALDKLTKIKGVGPATASAIIAAYDPKEPFMSDEAYEVVSGGGKLSYTVPAYKKLREQLLERCKSEGWKNVEELEMACWSYVVRERKVNPPPAKSSKQLLKEAKGETDNDEPPPKKAASNTKTAPPDSKKRKSAPEKKPAAEGSRRSQRVKKAKT